MLFTSTVFILFFLPCLLVCYFLIPAKWLRGRNLVLLVFSLVFYAWSGVRFLGILGASIGLNYLGGLAAGRWRNDPKGRGAVCVTVELNLALLGYFKYAAFAARSLAVIGLSVTLPSVALPVGISFFTFQGLSYVVDVYRGWVEVQKNPLLVALYLSLFPQLVAGPIVRYTDVARSLTHRTTSARDLLQGLTRFMLGFGKKLLLANAMGEVADLAFGQIGSKLLTLPAAWVGAAAYSLQIYYDFSAYSDMAIGLGRVFGFRFPENFRQPYLARSVTDFWRRWHISLSAWFRDYVYIPLGGNRCSTARQLLNLAVVWSLTGLWHGAAWNFVAWGAYYGGLLILEKFVFPDFWRRGPRPVCHLLTLLLVLVGWVLFRAQTLADAARYLSAMFGAGGFAPEEAVYLLRQYGVEFLCCVLGVLPLGKILGRFAPKSWRRVVWVKQALLAAFALGVFAISYMKLVSGSFNPFIYFQF